MRLSRAAVLGRLVFSGGLLLASLTLNVAADVRGDSEGHLATRGDAASQWSLLSAGDPIPEMADFRTSGAGVAPITAGDTALTFGPESAGRWNVSERSIALDSGRVLISPAGDAAWTVAANGLRIIAKPGAAISLDVSTGRVACDVLRGEAQIAGEGIENRTVAAPASAVVTGTVCEVTVPDAPDWGVAAAAWTQIETRQGPGQLLARDPQSGAVERLKIARYHVNVVLQPPVALVQIDQSFYNPREWQQAEGTFVFNLPPGASVSRFAMFVTHEELIEGELIERERANEVYTRIVTRRRDPAILEQIGDNLFRMRVFPVPARDTKRILLDYTVPLTAAHGKYRFELPLMSDLDPIWDLKLAGTIHPPLDLPTIVSPSHSELKFTAAADGSVQFELQQQQVQPPPALRLEYRAPVDQSPHVRSFSAGTPIDGVRRKYFVITIPPLDPLAATVDRRPLDVQIIADTSSGSSNLRLMRSAVRTIVAGLASDDRLQLGCVDLKYRPLTTGWIAPRSVEAGQALALLDEQFPLGSSMLWEAISTALATKATDGEGRRRIVVYVGDGASTDLPLRANWNSARAEDGALFTAVQIGEAPATEVLLRQIVSVTGGQLFPVGHSTAELGRVFEWFLDGAPAPHPVESVKVVDGGGAEVTDLFSAATWPVGETLDIAGRTTAEGALKVSLKLAGEEAAREYVLALPEVETDTDVFAGRYWAQCQLDHWLQQEQPTSADSELRKQIIALAQEWSLMCPYTAFLVLEKETDYERWKINRSVRHRYWKPAGALTAIPLPPEFQPGRKEEQKAAVAQSAETPPSTPARLGRDDVPDAQRFEAALKAAEAALSRKESARALVELLQVQPLAEKLGAERFDELWNRAQAGVARAQFLEGLELHRPLLDRRTAPALPSVDPLMVSLQFGGISPEYTELFPHAARLARRVKPPQGRTPPHGQVTLSELAAFVSAETGLNVILDQAALSEQRITGNEAIDLEGIREVTLHSLLGLALTNVNEVELDYVAEPSLIRITTRDVAEDTLQTMIYPIADVVRTDVLPSPARLSDPFKDLDRAMRERVRAKLELPVTVDFNKAPLRDVVQFFRDLLDENMRLDRSSLAEEGLTGDEDITLKLDNVPAKAALRLALENVNQIQLDYEIHDEVLNITTKDVVDDSLELRLYSLAGILYEIPEELIRRREPQNWQGAQGRGFGGGGFGGGGFGGGGAGFGGGGFIGGGFGGGGFGGGDDSPPWPDDASVSAVGPPTAESGAATPATAAEAVDSPASADSSATSDELVPSEVTPSETVFGLSGSGGTAHYDPTIDVLLEETEGPWESIDGIGGPDPREYRQSLSLFVYQTRRVHDEINDVLERLRKLPAAGPLVRRARIPRITENEPAGWEMDEIIDLILVHTTGPWESIDGIGGPDPREHTPSMSLIVRQTHRVHEEVYSMLAMMRRSRVIAGRSLANYRLSGADDLARMREDLSLTDLPTLPRRDGLPEPEDAELELLERARRTVLTGRETWRHSLGRGVATAATLTASGSRLQLELANHVLRADEDRAAVAYPGITLVELGAWGESVRRIADARFPWLPHRTNRELSQMFDIRVQQEAADGVTLRLTFPGAGDAFLLHMCDSLGQLLRAEAWLDGVRQYELRFEFDPAMPGRPVRVTAHDGDGALIEQWERSALQPEAKTPALAEGWGDFVVDDPDNDQTPYRRTRAALARYDYAEAGTILSDAVADRPQQPLLNLLLAWVDEFGGHPPTVRIEQRAALAAVVGSGAYDLARMITALNFPSLSDRDLYELLLAIPKDRRSAQNEDELGVLAALLDRPLESLAHVEAALARTPDTAVREIRDRQLDRIAALLRLGRTEEAAGIGNSVLAPPRGGVEDLVQIGDLFGNAGQIKLAEDYFARAREAAANDTALLAELLKREARWHAGARRWRILLSAAKLRTADAKAHAALAKIVLDEMSTSDDAVVAGMLAEEFADSPVATLLRIREAELTTVRTHAAEIAVALYDAGKLPEDRFAWMIGLAASGGRSPDVIRALEARLRGGLQLDDELRPYLVGAYRKAGREAEADRAASDVREVRPDESGAGATGRGSGWRGFGSGGFF